MSSSLSIVRGTNAKPVASDQLVKFFSKADDYAGHLFIGYPIIGTSEGRHPIDALLVSPRMGVVVFDLIEGTDPQAFQFRQDDSANKLEARLKTHRELMFRRDLLIDVHTLSFAPGIVDVSKDSEDDYPLANSENLAECLSTFAWSRPDDRVYQATLSAIQSITSIRRGKARRAVSNAQSRGAKLKDLEDCIATLDNLQSRAVVETVNGVQRIRGLAGSGKTIVLALKAAYLHAQHPDWRIAVTFNTRSLKGQFRRLINNFSVEQTGEEPDWENLRILNAWGAPGPSEREGIYHEYCRAHDIEYLDYRSAKAQFGSTVAFAGACETALQQSVQAKELYDAILIDESQDFPPAFLRLCFHMLDREKRLVYAYDELQNLSGPSLPPPEEIFGVKEDGSPVVSFDEPDSDGARRDVILDKCYRNSRPVLVTAHALGFGVYRDRPPSSPTQLVQMFDHALLWEEIGYRVKSGNLAEGSPVVLFRSDESSPQFLEDHSPVEDLVQFIQFESEQKQAEWLADEIRRNLEQDELRHDDIVVINPDPLTTRERVGPVRRRLFELGINSHLAGVDTDPDVFFQPESESVTFTGIHRAKGNEAGMVYIINAQDCQSADRNLASIRNRLFTGITRSKAWVRVLGFGDDMARLSEEFSRLVEHDFELSFRYPTKDERQYLQIVHRDLSAEERKRVATREQGIESLVADLEAGRVYPEDLSENLLLKLKTLLDNRR